MRLRRAQREGYDLMDYIEEVDKGEAKDPEEFNCRDVQEALQTIMKGSDAVRKVQKYMSILPRHHVYFVLCLYFEL